MAKKKELIRTTRASIHKSNTWKKEILYKFLIEFRDAVQITIDHIYEYGCSYEEIFFNVKEDKLNLPIFINYKDIPYTGKLCARAFCSAVEQALDIVRSQTEKRRRYQWARDKSITEGKSGAYFQSKMDEYPISKPIIKKLYARLSSKCIDFERTKNGHFEYFLRIKSTGFDHLKIPISLSKKFMDRLNQGWKLKGEINLKEDSVDLYQGIKKPEYKKKGRTVGIDTGILSMITVSDGQTSQPNKDGKTYSSILDKLARKMKGSKASKRAKDELNNYVNWSIKQINLKDIIQINLEHINLFNGLKKSKKNSRFAHNEIEQKIIDFAEERGVLVVLQSSVYKSQRCSCCGLVRKKNRKGKLYTCDNKKCQLVIDADLNAAINNELSLSKIPAYVRRLKLNETNEGFLWRLDGLFDRDGQALGVPDKYADSNEDNLP